METTEGFEGWAILELMGHRKLAGRVSEATLAGGAFLRIDVPGVPTEDDPDPVIATQYYAPAAVYCITPVTESVARDVAKHYEPAPVARWELPASIPARAREPRDALDEEGEFSDGEGDEDEDRA